VETVRIASPSGAEIAGWFLPGVAGRGAVLLLHGITDNRLRMVPRLRFLNAAGFAVLAIDFQAHGMSGGRRITLGALESHDAAAAVAYLRARLPNEKVGAVAISLGGAAALVGDNPLDVDALALESVYPDIRRATVNRFAFFLGRRGEPLADKVIAYGRVALGVDPDRLQPVERIGLVQAPVFVLAGDRDPWTPIGETRELFERAAAPKLLWEVPGAGHVDLYEYAPQEYRERVLAFLGPALSTGAA
jgi:pimeloyl-ACP methyl ester carboxylesterase